MQSHLLFYRSFRLLSSLSKTANKKVHSGTLLTLKQFVVDCIAIEQNFMAASKLAQQAKKRFVPIIGYGYGKKKTSNRGLPKFYEELAGKNFWTELTGDEEFYIKLIRFMAELPEKYVADFDESYQKAANRLVKEFANEFCNVDGSIDWEKLVEFNSGE